MPLYGDAKREYQRQWIARRRNAWIDSRGGRCEECGSTENLEVDHIDRYTKSMNPRNIWSLSAEKRETELAKCQVLCADCHKRKTVKELTYPHGTYARYDHGGCRCPECKATVAPQARKKRARAKERARTKIV